MVSHARLPAHSRQANSVKIEANEITLEMYKNLNIYIFHNISNCYLYILRAKTTAVTVANVVATFSKGFVVIFFCSSTR